MPSKTIEELEADLAKASMRGKPMTYARTGVKLLVLFDATSTPAVKRLRVVRDTIEALQRIDAQKARDATRLQAMLYQCEANAAIATNDADKGQESLLAAAREWKAVPDRMGEAGALEQLGHLHLTRERWKDASEALSRAAALVADQGDPWARGRIASLRGIALERLGDPAAALDVTELEIRTLGSNPRLLGLMQWQRAEILQLMEREGDAAAQAREAIETLERAKLSSHAAALTLVLAMMITSEDPNTALAVLDSARYDGELLAPLEGWALLARADILLRIRGRAGEALTDIHRASTMFAERGDNAGIAIAMDVTADVAEILGQTEKAAELRASVREVSEDHPGVSAKERDLLARIRALRCSSFA